MNSNKKNSSVNRGASKGLSTKPTTMKPLKDDNNTQAKISVRNNRRQRRYRAFANNKEKAILPNQPRSNIKCIQKLKICHGLCFSVAKNQKSLPFLKSPFTKTFVPVSSSNCTLSTSTNLPNPLPL